MMMMMKMVVMQGMMMMMIVLVGDVANDGKKKLIKRKCQYFADTDRPDTFQEAKVASKCAEGGSFPHTTELCFPFK